MSGRRDLLTLTILGLVVAGITALGIGVRATHGAQTTADEPQYLLSALSVWEDGNLDISDELADQRYRDFHEADLPQQTLELGDGRRVSPHDPLLPLLLAVPVGLGGWVGAKIAMAVLGGALAALTAWTAITRFGLSRSVAIAAAAIVALSPPLAVYSTQIYPAVPAALFLLAGLAAITGPFGRRGVVVFVLAVVTLPWLGIKFVPVAVTLAIFGLFRVGKGRRLPLVGILAGAGVIYVIGHVLIFGGLTAYSTGDHFSGGELTVVGAEVDLWGRSTRLIGLIVDRGFGIGAWQPLFLLLPLVVGWALARRQANARITATLLGVGWLVATFVALTMHGWWFPGRQIVVVLPMGVILMAAWADRAGRWQRRTLTGLGAAGVVAFVFLLAEGLSERLTWVIDFGSTTDPLYRLMANTMPDYMTPTSTTWILHGLWVVIAATLTWLGWHEGIRERDTTMQSSANQRQQRKVSA